MRLLTITLTLLAAASASAQTTAQTTVTTVYPAHQTTATGRPLFFPGAPWNNREDCANSVCQPRRAPARSQPPVQYQLPRVEIDYPRLLDMLAADARFRGPQGPTGATGATGQTPPAPKLDYAALREILAADDRFAAPSIDYPRLLALIAADERFAPPPLPRPPPLPPFRLPPLNPAEPLPPVIVPPGPVIEPPAEPPATAFSVEPIEEATTPPPAEPDEAKPADDAVLFGLSWFDLALAAGGIGIGALTGGVAVPWYLSAGANAARLLHERRRREREQREWIEQPRTDLEAERRATQPAPDGDEPDEPDDEPVRYGRQSSGRRDPITIETPPPPQAVYETQRFVNVQTDDHAHATAWAIEQTARKYPGAVPHLEVLQSLINQRLAADDAAGQS